MKTTFQINGNVGETRFTPCFWMQAGVARKKNCAISFECAACRYDRAMRRVAGENRRTRLAGREPAGRRGRIVFWRDKLLKLAAWKRPCLHHMRGRIGFRACTNAYNCGDCEFDQYFQDQFTVHTVVRPVRVLDVEGFRMPQGYYFHEGHTWLKIEEGGMARVGIDDFALRLMGPPDRIESPLVGKTVQQGRPHIRARRGENVADLISPVSGVVTDINPRLREKGGIANESPYADGWVMRVHARNLRGDLRRLRMGSETREMLEAEVDRLYGLIEEVAPLAADGGFLGTDIYGSLPSLGWGRITEMFLNLPQISFPPH